MSDCRYPSLYQINVKQQAIRGLLEEVNSWGVAQQFEIDVKIAVMSASSVGLTS
jgi:hypothetical protein